MSCWECGVCLAALRLTEAIRRALSTDCGSLTVRVPQGSSGKFSSFQVFWLSGLETFCSVSVGSSSVLSTCPVLRNRSLAEVTSPVMDWRFSIEHLLEQLVDLLGRLFGPRTHARHDRILTHRLR